MCGIIHVMVEMMSTLHEYNANRQCFYNVVIMIVPVHQHALTPVDHLFNKIVWADTQYVGILKTCYSKKPLKIITLLLKLKLNFILATMQHGYRQQYIGILNLNYIYACEEQSLILEYILAYHDYIKHNILLETDHMVMQLTFS